MSTSDDPLTIFAAGGPVPVHVATAAVAAGRPVFVVGLEGAADERLKSFPHEMVKWGQIGRVLDLLAAHGAREIVLIGTIDRRPDFSSVRVDLGAARILPKVLPLLAGGDDTVLSGLVRLFETEGYEVRGAHEIAPDLVAPAGHLVGRRPSAAQRRDVKLASEAARTIGALDAGQAAVAVQSRVVALEGAEGTDAMLRRVDELRQARLIGWSGRAGVLAKCAKPDQDIRVDMPTIGSQTVKNVAAAGLAGIAIEPGRVMIVDRDETVAMARKTGTFIAAVAVDEKAGGS